MIFLTSFFQYFGFFAFIGCIVLIILVNKELKKQLPTEAEKKEMLAKGLITGSEKKKVLREKTLKFRYDKKFKEELKKALTKQTQSQGK